MKPLTTQQPSDTSIDPDLAEQARPGHGVPSQDPAPEAQFPLAPEERERESKSVFTGGGALGGAATGAAVGMAVAAKHWGDTYRTYALLGDGESEEGQVWEAAMFAGNHQLDNLCVIVDHNGVIVETRNGGLDAGELRTLLSDELGVG